MAEFKLGRIKFVYQGAWTTGHNYVVDDVITNGGKTYICVISHTSSSLFATDLAGIPGVTKWNLIADGSTWRNTWAATTYYNLGDIVVWGATVYICKTAHTSQTYLEDDLSKWDTFSAGFKWLGAWSTSTRYKVRDLIYYGGTTYVCNTQHTSAASSASGLEADIGKWDIFNQGITYLGDWSGSSVRYKVNDVVKFGADLWICTTYHTSTGTSIDTGNFSIFVNGFQFEGSWSGANEYQVGDVVTYGGYTYTAIQNSGASSPQTPSTATSYWKVFTSGLVYSGEWDNSTSYKIGNVVTLGGYTYVATADNSASKPPSGNWGQLSSGIRWASAPSTTYTNVSSTNITATGSGSPTFTVTRNGTAYTVVVGSTAGSGYTVNDTLKILGSNLGGASPGNDLVVKVATITGGGATGPMATVTVVSGFAATWKNGVTYVAGDAVYYGNSSYICTSAHVGSIGVNDPSTDTSGTYWNILSNGADSGAMTTQGDMVYYGPNGPVRLPIGKDGQILRVNGDTPEWQYYGELQNVVYVAPNGSDVSENGQGLTLDKPWASVLFACRQIEEGYLNPNAGLALEVNKQFMIKEVNNFIQVNYSFNITGTSGSGNTFIVGGSSTTSQITTANMYYGMPITFSATTGGITVGTTYYVNTIPSSTTFTISDAYQSGSTRAITASSVTASVASFVYTQSKAERDAGTVIDGVIFDLTHGGNLYCVTATQAFFSTLTTFTSTGTTQQSPVFAGALVYLKDYLLPAVLSNNSPATVYQTVKGIAVTSQAIQNTTVVTTSKIETGSTATAQGLLGIVTGAILAKTYGNIPQLSRPHTTIYLKTGTYNEYGPIVVPIDTAIVGDELRSTIVQVAKAQTYLGTDKPKTSTAIRRIRDLIPAIVNNMPVRVTSTTTAKQQYISNAPYSSFTSTISSNASIIQTTLAGGLASIPGAGTTSVAANSTTYTVPNNGTYTLTTPTGFGSSLTDIAYACSGNTAGTTTNYDKAVANIQNNITFIQAEVAAYMNTAFASVWSSMGATDKAATLRDVAYLLNSMIYDITYGGNTQSTIDGLAYYSLGLSNIIVGYQAATVGMITRIQTIMPNIVNGVSITRTTGNALTQTLSYTGTYTNAATYATALVTLVLNWINGNNGTGNSLSSNYPGTVEPAISWVSAANITAYNNIKSNKATIQSWIQNYVGTNYPTIVTNLALTYRDAGTIVDALAYDLLLGSTFYSLVAGRAFYRLVASAQALVGGGQLAVTQSSIKYITVQVAGYAAGSTVGASGYTLNLGNTTTSSIVTNTSTLQSILAGGLTAVPGYSSNTITTTSASYTVTGYGSQTLSTPTNFGTSLTNTAYSVTGLGVAGYTGNVTGATTGYDKAVTNINNNIVFLQTEIAAYLETYSGSGFSWSALSAGQKSQTLRDVAFLLQSVKYDLTYGGNTQSQIDGLAYWSLGSNTLTSAAIIAGTTAALSRLETIIPYIVNGTTVGYTKSASNGASQTLTNVGPYANAALYAQALIKNVINWINGTNTPASGGSLSTGYGQSGTVQPCLTWESAGNLAAFNAIQAQRTYIQTQIRSFVSNQYPTVVASLDLTYRDAGTVIDALSYDLLLGTNYFSIVAGRAFYRANSSAQTLLGTKELNATQDSIDYISYRIGSIASSVDTLPATVGDMGNVSSVDLVVNNTKIIQDMFSGGTVITGPSNPNYPNGLSLAPAISTPAVTGYNSSYLVNYGDGVTLIRANYQFIKDEIVNFLNTDGNLTGSAQWSSYSSTYKAETLRDLSYILDAVCYDMTYGCNSQSLIVGSSFYSLNTAQLFSPYLIGVLEALSRLSTILGQIVQKTAVTVSSGNSTTQNTSGTAGSAAAASFAQARVADVVYWINNGISDPTSATFTGSISTTTLTVSSVSGTIKIGQIVTGGTVAAGTYITAGSGTSWTVSVSQTATATGSTMAITPIVSGAYALASTANKASFDAIQARASEIANDATVWVTRFYQNESPVLVLTTRDAGYVVSALAYDVLFGGNFQSIQAGRSYNRLVTSVVTLQSTLADSTYGAIGFIGERIKLIAANGSTIQTQSVVNEMISQIYGQPTSTATFNGTITGTQLVVNGSLSGTIAVGMQLSGVGIAAGTTIVSGATTSITGAYLDNTAGTFKLAAALSSALVVGQQVTISGTFSAGSITSPTYVSGTIYYVIGTPTTTSFQLSATQGGSAITTTTGGTSGSPITGITITASPQNWLLNYNQSVSSTTTSVIKVTTSVVLNGNTYTNVLTAGTTTGFVPGLVITLTGSTIGTLTAGTYYIKQVLSSTQFTVSTTYLGSVFAIDSTATGALTAVVYGIYGGLALNTNITASGTAIPVTSVATSTNLITVSSNAGMLVDMPITFTSLPANITTTATTISSSSITLSATVSSLGVVVGQKVWFTGFTPLATGTQSSIVENQVYYVKTASASAITIAATLGGTALTLTNATGLTLTANFNAAGGLVNGVQYWINSITQGTYPAAGTTITVTDSYRSGTAFVITNNATMSSATCTAGMPTNQGINDKNTNGTIQPWNNAFGTYGSVSGYNNTLSTINGAELIRANKDFLAAEAVEYVRSVYSATVTSTATNGTLTCSTNHNLTVNDPVVFSGTIFDANLTAGTVYWVLSTPSATTFTITITAPNTTTPSVKTLTSSSGSMKVTYYIRTAQAIRDAGYHIDGLVYDLGLTGNYKATRSAQVYLSAQGGAVANDLFHLRNGTGLRNMTLNGMTGALTLPNTLGTRRPTAGAYSSLDAGFGPNDSNAWISYRSPYTQNCTLFGSGCSGMKIDAALHNGGNKSIVANDYTTIISDGLGVWCTGSGALTELVSVFAYYSYAGYLAEYGGRIRATNGNSSYGTYGVIAEGIDSYETPIYGRLNNRASSAYVTNVVTDGTDEILRLEFQNAGSAYTNTLPTINGAGYNILPVQDEFRDSAVFETRLVDLNNGQGTGGSNYLTASNVAQTGTVGNVTIANSDIQLSSAYIGMRIQLIAGTGVGQYANIIGYRQDNKNANIVRPSFAPLTITTNNTTVFTVASTATMYVGQPIYMGAAIGGLSITGSSGTTSQVYTPTVYYVSTTSFTSTTFRLSTTLANAQAGTNITLTATSATPAVMASSLIIGYVLTVGTLSSGVIYPGMLLTGGSILPNTYIVGNILGSGAGSTWVVSTSQNLASTTLTGTVSVPVYEAGWDHVVAGDTIQPVIDATSAYVIEPAIAYSSPGYDKVAITMTAAASTTWSSVAYGQGKFVAISNATGVASTATTADGTTWAAGGNLPTDASSNWGNIVYGGGQGATGTAVVGGVGGSGATAQAVIGTGNTAGQIISITITNSGYNYLTPPTIVITDATGAGATATARVLNGQIKAIDMVITGSLYTNPTVTIVTSSLSSITATTWGSGYYATPTVAIAAPFAATSWGSGGAATSGAYYSALDTTISPNMTNYYLAGGSGTFSATKPTFTNSVYGDATKRTATGIGASATYGVTLTYVGSLAVATATTNTNSAGYGVISYTISQTGYGYSSNPTITVTDPNAAFIAISNATSSAAYSTDQGTTWAATAGNTGKTNLKSLAYGNNLYIAVGGTSSGVAVSYYPGTLSSLSSTTWSDQSSFITTNSSGYTSVAYGAGVFCAIGGTISSFTAADPTKWYAGATLPSKTWASITYGNNRFVALASDGTVYYTINWNPKNWTINPSNASNNTWVAASNNPLYANGVTTWSRIRYGQGLFVAIATSSQAVATSPDGLNWTYYATGMPSSSNWLGIAFGNPQNATLGAVPTWVAVSNTSGKTAARIYTGATPQGRIRVVNNQVSEIRMIEPGSGFARGNVTATSTTSTGTITTDSIINLSANQPIVFNGTSAGGIKTGTYYYVKGTPTANTFQISTTAGGAIYALSAASISGMTYFAGPIITQTDPNKVNTAPVVPRIGNGALGNPSFTHRGTANTTATASYAGDGYADLYQVGTYVNVSGLYEIPKAGCNVVFNSITGTSRWYKLVAVTNVLGVAGNYTATFQINPGLSVLLAPLHNDLITTNLAYSNVRLTGHDFLYIGTGGVTATNYPYVDPTKAVSANQQLFVGGGRVFFTSTDQDGNFNVGNLFGVQQSTGTATLNASAFNLSGLQSLTLGSVSLGVGSATITQFSTDPYFTANSDSVVPTQKAIKAFITAQIGGGQSSLNVNTITSGQIYIAGNTISNTTPTQIYVSSKMLFTGGIDGAPVALVYFGQR